MGGGMMGGGMMGGMEHAAERNQSWWRREGLFTTEFKFIWMWSPTEVAKWVSLIEGMDEYAVLFVDNGIDGNKLLMMDGIMLTFIGVQAIGHKARLLDELAYLRKYGPSKHVHRYVTGEDGLSPNIWEGIWDGLWGEFAYGVFDGLAAPIYEPIKGAVQEGAEGFWAGVPAGMCKFFLMPTAAFLDGIRHVSEGIRCTPQMLWSNEERYGYMREKCMRERRNKAGRRKRGKKDKAPITMDSDYATTPIKGVTQGIRRFGKRPTIFKVSFNSGLLLRFLPTHRSGGSF